MLTHWSDLPPGYEYTDDGYVTYFPPDEPIQNTPDRRAALRDVEDSVRDASMLLVGEAVNTGRVFTSGVVGHGVSGEQVLQVERELAKVPKVIRGRWREAGGEIELWPAATVPLPTNGVGVRGFCQGVRCVVALGSEHPLETALHEMGHCLDTLCGKRGSSSAAWLEIFKLERDYWKYDLQPAYGDYGNTNESECFACAFAAYCGSEFTRSLLPKRPREFIEKVIQSF
jgi:hypothetical protein